MGIAARLIVCSALALMSASARAQQPAIDATKFYSALSCRLMSISGGQLNTAAIFEDTPDPVSPLRLIRVDAATPKSELEVITPRQSLMIGHYAFILDRFYWTPNDDLVIWSAPVFLHLAAKDIRSTPAPRFRTIYASTFLMFFPQADVIPEHIRTTARIFAKDSGREPIQFEPATRNVSNLPIPVGPQSAAGWTANDEFVRLRSDYGRRQRYLDVFEPASSEWIPFTRSAMPANSELVLVRDNPAAADLEVVIRWRERGGDRIGVVTRGAQKPKVIASDTYIDSVLVSPDRTRIYGFVDLSGRFRQIGTERQTPDVAFWLAQLEKRRGLEKVYFLKNAKFALIKVGSPVAGSEIQLLERRGNTVNVRETFCRGGSNVAGVKEGEHSVLFVPKEMSGSKLLVYLHDGPFGRVDRRGNWLIDLLLSSGNPVLAVNYTGSVGRVPPANDRTNRTDAFGDDVARAVAFGLREAGARTVVLVGEGFGSIVGLSALAGQKISASGFVSVSGLVRYERLSSEMQSGWKPTFTDYGRIAREARAALDPSRIGGMHPQLEFLFVHGDKDDLSPYTDITNFVQNLGTTGSPRSAIKIVGQMDHSPYRRADYDQILKHLSDFLSRH